MLSWGVSSYAFYFVMFYLNEVDVNIYLMAILIGLADVIGSFLYRVFLICFGTKKLLLIFYITILSTSLLFAVSQTFGLEMKQSPVFMILILTILRLVSGMSFILSYYANTEFFPTLLKSSIFAATNFTARLCTALSPATSVYISNPMYTVSGAAAITIVFIFGLK